MTDNEIVPLPAELTKLIAERALQLAREQMARRGWRSGDKLVAEWDEGYVNIRSEVPYLYYQDQGTKPFLMTALVGKTVPIANVRAGTTNFRTVKGVGEPGWVWIPWVGRVWRDQKWRHPGIKPTYFIEDSINKAIMDFKSEIEAFQAAVQLVNKMGVLE